jgi:AcrR family transcriptional regulator
MTGKERRDQLLDIGRRLFADRGLDGTSIEEIAAKAGVSKPVVYEHFGGKEGPYAVVVDREVERFLTMATRLLDGEDTMAKFRNRRGAPAALHPGELRRLPHPRP